MANYFAQFHDEPVDGAPSGDASSDNYFTRFHPEAEGKSQVTIRPVGKPVSQGEAAGLGLAQGATLNFGDELYAASKASGLDHRDAAGPFSIPIGAGKMWWEDLTGQNDPRFEGSLPEAIGEPKPGNPRRGEATKRYEEAVAERRDLLKRAGEQWPKTMLGTELAGGFLTPVPGGPAANALKALPWWERLAQSAKFGAGYGAGSGVGEGEGAADSATRGVIGGVVGLGVGAGLNPLVEGAAVGVNAAGRKVRDIWERSVQPDKAAARVVGNTMLEGVRADPNAERRLTGAEMAATPEATVADFGGGPTRMLADVSGILNPEAQTRMSNQLKERVEGQYPRFKAWLDENFSYPRPFQQGKAIEEAATNVNSANYKQAMADGAGGIWSDELARIARVPAVRDAAKGAIRGLQNRSIDEGFKAPRSQPLQWDPETGAVSLTPTMGGKAEIVPDLRYWDQVKRNLDKEITKARDGGDKETVNELTPLKNALLRELDKHVDSYKAARQGAAHFFGENNALDAGVKMVHDTRMSNDELRYNLAHMSETERNLFKDGFIGEYSQFLSSHEANRNLLTKIKTAPKAQERLEIVMGKQKYAEFEAMLRIEGIEQATKEAIGGNSATVRRAVQLGMTSVGGGMFGDASFHNSNPMGMEAIGGTLLAAIGSGGRFIDKRLAGKVVEMLMSRDPAEVQRAISVVAAHPKMMQGLENFDRHLIATTAQHGHPNISLPTTVGGAGAQDQQPSDPGQVNY
jgi:hypothetical protein